MCTRQQSQHKSTSEDARHATEAQPRQWPSPRYRGSAPAMAITTLQARLAGRDVDRRLCGFVRGSRSAGEEKDLQRDLPGVITLHWMIAEGCRGTQACNLLVATI